jgi:xanthine/uracil permease
LVYGVVLALVEVLIHFLGSGVIHTVLPPVVTGAVVMLIGFNLAPVVANIYRPQDQWVELLVMVFTIACALGLRGFLGRIAIFLALIFGTALSWVFVRVFGMISSLDPGAGKVTEHFRVNWDGVASAPWLVCRRTARSLVVRRSWAGTLPPCRPRPSCWFFPR